MQKVDMFRFAIGGAEQLHSSVWSVKGNRNDVYLGVRRMMGALKVSIHGGSKARLCQIALTRQYWDRAADKFEPPMDTRALATWKMRKLQVSGVVQIASVWFPTNHLRCSGAKPPPKTIFVHPPAQQGKAVRLAIFESLEDPEAVACHLQKRALPVGHFNMEDGRNISLALRVERFDENLVDSLRGRPGHNQVFDPSGTPAPGETKDGLFGVGYTEAKDEHVMHLVQLHDLRVTRERAA